MSASVESGHGVRWSIHSAASEFDLDDKTLAKQIKSSGVIPAADGMFSTLDICKAVFGDLKGDLIRAQTRNQNEMAGMQAVKKANLLRENIPSALVEKVWSNVIIELRQKILYAEIPNKVKEDILKDLQSTPIDDYFRNTTQVSEEDSDEVPVTS